MRSVAFPAVDTVVILDVLHYVARHEQDEVLARARAALGDSGTLLLRVGDAASRGRFAASQWGRLASSSCCAAAGRGRTTAGRREWVEHLVGLGFSVAGRPMSQGTPFANVLLVATLDPREPHLKPTALDHAGIEARVPHRGTMCLLERMVAWDDGRIECLAGGHRDPAHPLRSASGLMAGRRSSTRRRRRRCTAACSPRRRARARRRGYLASAREVRLGAWRLDDLPRGGDDALRVVAERQAGEPAASSTPFAIEHGGREIASGRLAVVLDAPARRA
jgi:predicted hotdog family 3-hydroxylacyl-ACP dehydratase